jgi:hypothetical protein
MYFPKFWSRGNGQSAGGDIDVEAWGWSDTSEQDAAGLASSRAGRLAEAIARGERGKGYLYGSNPLREQILERLPSSAGGDLGVVSRNAYGCDVLNTESVLFCDIDIDESKQSAPLSGILGGLFGRKQAPQETPEQKELAKVRSWVAANSSWGIQAYRTKAGLRLIATHELFDPTSDRANQFFEAVGADPYFRRLCKIQKSFRARLTPKPWRCGSRMPPSRWPFPDQREEGAFDEWRRAYETAASQYAVCQRLEHIGQSGAHPDVQRAMKLHDERTKIDSGLPLA